MNKEQPQKIIIIGGGTAGWMTANLFADKLSSFDVSITLIDSSKIGTVGVGEGSTPYLKEFFQRLNIAESEWMPACNATFKCGIRFPLWADDGQNDSYFHPFYSDIDGKYAKSFFSQCNGRRAGQAAYAHPDAYFTTAALANNQKAPKYISNEQSDDSLSYGYHFDQQLLGEFLKQHALKLGVIHLDDQVDNVHQGSDGNIAILSTENHGLLRGDFFVDCSGFKGLLIQEVLGEKLQSYEKYLFNNSAVAIATANESNNTMPCETVSKALSHGWVWHIPLTNRMGNGYVYSSNYLSEQEAEQELRSALGLEQEGKAIHLHWQPGRLANHWKKNCLAIGLSQGFLEPLEAPMLYITQRSIESFLEYYIEGQFTIKNCDKFNREINNIIDGTRDYLQAHYKINTRTDSEYWRDNRENPNVSVPLTKLMTSWQSRNNFDQTLAEQLPYLSYLKTSWYCLFAGKSFFKSSLNISADLSDEHRKIIKSNESKSNEFYDHASYLKQYNDKNEI